MLNDNILLMTDSYKFTHYKQYPEGTEKVYSYLESRGGEFKETVFFGLQYFIKKYLVGQVVTKEKIDQAEKFVDAHIGPGVFNRVDWEYILEKYDGRLPLKIRAIPEGTVIKGKNALVVMENTDERCFWLTNYLETIMLNNTWYGITVATLSKNFKDLINVYLEETGDPSLLPFKLHDFGYRGVSSNESAAIGGAAHLINFMGTDTVAGALMAMDFYQSDMPGFSIPASEHSTITSWGKKNELAAFENMLDQYPTGLVACVSDSFNIYKACEEYWGTQLKDKILGRDGTLVVRPDSGNPIEVVIDVLNLLGEKFGYEVNSKGYKVLPPQIRVIQGDGIDLSMCEEILEAMKLEKWSADNVAFGCGGALLQKLNRDTLKFAFKCSNITINGEDRPVFKDPVTDPGKVSKKGKFKVVLDKGFLDDDLNNERHVTVRLDDPREDCLIDVFENGTLLVDQSFSSIRERSNKRYK